MQPLVGREGGTRARHASPALQGRQQGCLLAADESPGALLDLDVEAEVRPQNVLAENAELLGLLDGDPHVLHRQGVLSPDVDVAFGRAEPFRHGVRTDCHALEH